MMLKKTLIITTCLLCLTILQAGLVFSQQQVVKTNPMKVYMHYMPWFETPASIGKWGWHWTMNNQNPNIIGTDGKRQIASHYYPLIGPYASRDKDVIEYHMLLLKLSGVDGLLLNWYGVAGSNGDIVDLLKSSDSIVSYTDDFGLQFSVVMEDRFSRSQADVKANLAYLKNNYFNRPEYIRMGAGQDPLVCIFGPITFQTPSDWTAILPSAGEEIEFVTLWNESGEAGSNADGEFAWVFQSSTKNHMVYLDEFYKNRLPSLKTAAGSAYPGFQDFYEEGAAGTGYFTIPPYFGSTLDATFAKAEEYKAGIDMLQLVTFNDFGEGTMFEPTEELGFDYLKRLQKYTGVSYGETELRLVYRLFLLRKEYSGNPEIQLQLNQASTHLKDLKITEASEILNSIVLASLKENDKGAVNQDGTIIFPNPYTGGKLEIFFKPDYGNSIHLSIKDISGRNVYEKWLEKGESSHLIDNINLPAGVYLLILKNITSREAGKFIVSN